jgi:hypothetical protein
MNSQTKSVSVQPILRSTFSGASEELAIPQRNGWIFCGGMIRSASTLQYQMASELIERTGFGRRTCYYDPSEHMQALSGCPNFGFSTFKSHEVTQQIALICEKEFGKALYIYRDLRDVISSFQQKEATHFGESELTRMVAHLLKTDREWRSLPNVYVSRYEDVVGFEQKEIINIAEFLQIPVQQSLVTAIIDSVTYRGAQEIIKHSEENDWIEVNSNNIYHQHTLLHKNHLQGGVIGRFRADLLIGQQQLIESVAGDWLEMYGYAVYY